MSDDLIKVALRIRPLLESEIQKGCLDCLDVIDGEPQVQIKNTEKSFRFNHVFSPEATQQEFYQSAVHAMIPEIFQGFNVTILAYGQTGSGKTYSMGTNYTDKENPGIIPRAVYDIYKTIEEKKNEWSFKVHVSFLELYKEQLYDLLANKDRSQCVVDIREDMKNIVVVGLTEKLVNSADETLRFLADGSAARATGATAMNEQSSRSHAVFTVTVYQEHMTDVHQSRMAKFHFVDLAGSERSKKTQATGERFKEGVNINKGLLALGNVISQLGDGKSSTFVNYRDSKLTRLLQDSLGGNSVTLMIACASPADYNLEETLSTLRYADRARKIKNKPVVNQDSKSSEILQLKNKIAELEAKACSDNSCPPEHEEMQAKILLYTSRLNRALAQTISMHEKNDFMDGVIEKYKTCISTYTTDIQTLINTSEELMEVLNKGTSDFKTIKAQFEKIYFQILELKKNLSLGQVESYLSCSTIEAKSVNSSIEEGITAEDTILLSQAYNAEHEEHANRQEEAGDMVLHLDAQLAAKETMMKKLIESYSVDHLKDVQEMESEIKKLQEEKASLQNQLSSVQTNEKCSKLAETRRKKIQELEKKITELNRKCVEFMRVMKEKENGDHQIQNLKKEMQNLKQTKVKLIKDMRADSDKFNRWKLERERELIKLKTQERKRNFEMAKLQNQYDKKSMVFKRKIEEGQAQNKRLKDVLQKKKLVEQSRLEKGKKPLANEDSQVMIMREAENLQSIIETHNCLEKKLKEREDVKKLLDQAKRSVKNEIEEPYIAELQFNLNIYNKDIAQLQKKIVDSNEETIMNNIRSCVNKGADAMKVINFFVEISKKKAEPAEEIVISSDSESSDNVQEQLDKYKRKINGLKQKISTKKPKSRDCIPEEQGLVPEEQGLDSSVEMLFNDDEQRDPDWKRTPLFKRVKRRTQIDSRYTRNEATKRSVEGETKCSCRTQCKTRICSCRKMEQSCSPSCACTAAECNNREKVNQPLFKENTQSDSELEVKKLRFSQSEDSR